MKPFLLTLAAVALVGPLALAAEVAARAPDVDPNCIPGMIWAAWQGRASPVGVISISLRPQPPMQGLGYLA